MKTLRKYAWVKLHRSEIPAGKGVMGWWMKLASRVAYRSGKGKYCGHINEVAAGEWVGGIVGIKSILGLRSKEAAESALASLETLGCISYDIDRNSKRLSYRVTDWVHAVDPEPAEDHHAVYPSVDRGFLCIPRGITRKYAESGAIFQELDAWLDLWCHTVVNDPKNAFSSVVPVIQMKNDEIALTLDKLGTRWKWEKTKVWRFFQKYRDTFALIKLPGSQGCIIANPAYDHENHYDIAIIADEIVRILNEIRTIAANTPISDNDHDRINLLLVRYSGIYSQQKTASHVDSEKDRVALFAPITRAYHSPVLIAYLVSQYPLTVYDCQRIVIALRYIPIWAIRGP